MEIHTLIPQHKGGMQTAQLLFAHTYEEVRPILPELLEWIQDMNWPVAKPVAEYLLSISAHITREILEILQGDDDIWKYGCLHVFCLGSEKEIDPLVKKEVVRIVEKPSQGEMREEVYEVAKKVLEKISDKG